MIGADLQNVQVWVATTPVDMRKSFDSLAEVVRSFLAHDPLSGNLFVFRNKAGHRLKILWWDRGGPGDLLQAAGARRVSIPAGQHALGRDPPRSVVAVAFRIERCRAEAGLNFPSPRLANSPALRYNKSA